MPAKKFSPKPSGSVNVAESEEANEGAPEEVKSETTIPATGEIAVRNAELQIDASEAKAQQDELLRRLLARDKQRAEAPEGVKVERAFSDGRDVTIALWREQGYVAEEESVYTDSKEKHDQNISEGWLPVVIRGRHATIGGDLAYKRDKRISELLRKEARLRARELLASVGKEMAEADPTGEVLQDNDTAYSPADWERRSG